MSIPLGSEAHPERINKDSKDLDPLRHDTLVIHMHIFKKEK